MKTNFKPTDVTGAEAEASPTCVSCQKPIGDDHWFCRLPKEAVRAADPHAEKILLCSPACALRFFANLHPKGNGYEPDYDRFEGALPVLVNGQNPAWVRN